MLSKEFSKTLRHNCVGKESFKLHKGRYSFWTIVDRKIDILTAFRNAAYNENPAIFNIADTNLFDRGANLCRRKKNNIER